MQRKLKLRGSPASTLPWLEKSKKLKLTAKQKQEAREYRKLYRCLTTIDGSAHPTVPDHGPSYVGRHLIVPFEDDGGVWRGYHGTVVRPSDEADDDHDDLYYVECEDGDAAVVTRELIDRLQISSRERHDRKRHGDYGHGFVLQSKHIPRDTDVLAVLVSS